MFFFTTFFLRSVSTCGPIFRNKNCVVDFHPFRNMRVMVGAPCILALLLLTTFSVCHAASIRGVVTDTTGAKEQSLKLAAARLEAVRQYLVRKLSVNPARVTTVTYPLSPGAATELRDETDVIRTELTGRTPLVAVMPETMILPPATDERTQHADSLAVGAVSSPFLYKGYYTIVRLNARDGTHRKTYEEAGPELSSTYQDYESKRLEGEWLTKLRQKYPVVEYKPILKNAFATVR